MSATPFIQKSIAHWLKIIVKLFIFLVLTVLTQVGGIVYLLSFLTHRFTDRRATNTFLTLFYRTLSFLVLYAVSTFFVVPFIAKPLGRVPLPLTETHHLKPLTIWTCLLNRHYVRPQLREAAYTAAAEMNEHFPGTTVNYLDANFPFINKFPLLPHLSHNDGKKLDLSFCYRDSNTNEATNECPSVIGYGICEDPLPGESNTAAFCADKGYMRYSLLTRVVPQGRKPLYIFDAERTRYLVNLFASSPAIGKIFIEPHLVGRLQLTSGKIRFHGCQAVRHDDHIHIQLK